MQRQRTNNLPQLAPEEFCRSMKEYAEAILEAVKSVPEPTTVKREDDAQCGPRCVCSECWPQRMAGVKKPKGEPDNATRP